MSLSLSDAAEIVAKQFWRMALIGGLCAAAAAWALLATTPTYEARTLLLYKLGREYLFIPDAGEASPGVRSPNPGDLMQIIGAEMQIVVNRDLRRRFVEEFGPDRIFADAGDDPETIDNIVEALRGMVSVSLIPNTLMVEIRVRHQDPEIASEMANTLVDLYLDRRNQVFFQRDSEYFRARLTAAQSGVQDFEERIRDLLGGVDPLVFQTDLDIRVARQSALEAQIADVEANVAGLTIRRQEIERELSALEPTIVEFRSLDRNPVVSAAQTRMLTLQAEREAAAASLGAAHPTVRSLEREIEGLRQVMAREPAEVETGGRIASNPARLRAEANLVDTNAALREYEARRDHLVRERDANAMALARAAQLSSELTGLQRVAELQNAQAAQLDARLRESVAEESQGREAFGSVRILERASAPMFPVGPPRSIRLMVALLVGGIVGLAVGVLSYLARPTVLTARMLETRLGAPALAEIPWRRPGRGPQLAEE